MNNPAAAGENRDGGNVSAGRENLFRRAGKTLRAQPRGVRWLWALAALEIGYFLAQQLDTGVFTSLRGLALHCRPLWEFCKSAGYFPFWLAAAAVMAFCDWLAARKTAGRTWRDIFNRGGLLCCGAFASMAVAELLKLVVRRERPQAWLEVASVFRDWSGDWWQSNDLGMPSSHAATAFGAAFVLLKLFPAGRGFWWALAVACALSRVADQAHALTDVYAGAVVAWGVAALVIHWWRPRA